ncbi:hypothetical protein OG21DRAFT_1244710 [Imleria badia]|nr:hypothetical protein OG21DRAFT_1244710 [Imleria badia]
MSFPFFISMAVVYTMDVQRFAVPVGLGLERILELAKVDHVRYVPCYRPVRSKNVLPLLHLVPRPHSVPPTGSQMPYSKPASRMRSGRHGSNLKRRTLTALSDLCIFRPWAIRLVSIARSGMNALGMHGIYPSACRKEHVSSSQGSAVVWTARKAVLWGQGGHVGGVEG